MTVADTDVLVDALRGHEPSASRVASELQAGRLLTSAISRFELMSGAHTRSQQEAVRTLLSGIPALPLDDGAADRAAEVRKRLEKRGEGIGMADSLIAGIVLENGAALMTRNRKHFERVEGLRLASLG